MADRLDNKGIKNFKTVKLGSVETDTSLFYEYSGGSFETKDSKKITEGGHSYVIDYNKYIQSGGIGVNPNLTDHYNIKKPITPYTNTESKDLSNHIDIDSLIKWSERTRNGRLRYQDFAFCKNLGYLPNNRMVVLRRYQFPIKDNIFDTKVELNPLSTMISWVAPDKMSDLLKFTFHENWTNTNKDFMDYLSSAFGKGAGIVGDLKSKYVDKSAESFMGASGVEFVEELLAYSFLDKLVDNQLGEKGKGRPRLLERFPEGNPNIIKEASMRMLSGKTTSNTLTGKFIFNLEFEFEANRYLSEIDPSIAFLDLLANALRMSTSDSEFKLPPEVGDDFTQKLVSGDLGGLVKIVMSSISDVVFPSGDKNSKKSDTIIGSIKNIFSGSNTKESVTIDGNKQEGDVIFKALVSKYIEEIKAAYSVMTGAPSGLWHLTIGNPKSPIISIGDMIVKSSTITFGSELGFNDLPTSFKYSVTVESARNRGRQEIEQIFNSGRGRIYKRVIDGQLSSYDDALFLRQIQTRASNTELKAGDVKPANQKDTNDLGTGLTSALAGPNK